MKFARYTIEEAYPVSVGVHDVPFTKGDWATEKMLIVLSFLFLETGREIVVNVGSDLWIKIASVIKHLQRSAGPS